MADTDEKAQEIGRHFMWTEANRMKEPREYNDPPGYQSREALHVKQRPTGRFGDVTKRMTSEEQQELNIVIVGNPETGHQEVDEGDHRTQPGLPTHLWE